MFQRTTWRHAIWTALCCGCAQWPAPPSGALAKVETPPAAPASAAATPAANVTGAAVPAAPAATAVASNVAPTAHAIVAAAAAPAKPAAAAVDPKTPDPQAMANALAEIQALGGLDAAAQQRLVTDLQNTPPNLWPALLMQFKAAIAYRDRAKLREEGQTPSAERVAIDAVVGKTAPTAAVAPVSHVAPVAQVTPVKATSGDWRQSLQETIAGLEKALESAESPKEGAKQAADPRQVQLRLLYLLDGQKDQALKPLTGFDAGEQEYWGEQLFALSVFLDPARGLDPSKRAAEAAPHLDAAAAKLGRLGALTVRNIAFCTEVTSYGVYKQFEQEEFAPGQQLLLYAEIDNLASQASRQGHRTSLRSSYQIFNARGDLVEEQEFPVTEDLCAHERRDFFIRYFLNVPAKAYAGRHTLQLTIEDALARKIGQATISFKVRDAGK